MNVERTRDRHSRKRLREPLPVTSERCLLWDKVPPGKICMKPWTSPRVSQVKGVGIIQYIISAIYRVAKIIGPTDSFTLRFETQRFDRWIRWASIYKLIHEPTRRIFNLGFLTRRLTPLLDTTYLPISLPCHLSISNTRDDSLIPSFLRYYHRYFVETKRLVERND